MKVLLFLLFTAVPLLAQWKDIPYTIKGGWNAIYLYGDATHTTPDQLFAAGDGLQVEEVWRWNPNPSEVQFTSDPFNPTPGTPEWSTWYRTPPGGVQGTLSGMGGQAAYLVKCSGTASNSYSVTIPQKILPPRATWVRNGANLLGFPVVASPSPTFSAYFDTFPAALAAGSEIYRYVGGPLGAGNPLQLFDPTFETLQRGQAYWFEAQVVGTYYAPLEVTASHPDGLAFGRTGSVVTVRVRNRTSAAVTLTVAPEASDTPPVGTLAGPVPLTLLEFDSGSGQYLPSPFGASRAFALGPQASLVLRIGIDRGALAGPPGSLFGSLLRFTETGLAGGPLMDLSLPVSAERGTLAGLWVGEVAVDSVASLAAGSPGSTVARPFPLRFLMHIDDTGTTRLLGEAYVGTLASNGEEGVGTTESVLDSGLLASARRFSAAHMPVGSVIEAFGGPPAFLSASLTVDFYDPANPFVHRYHPDHDNTGPQQESYDISRSMNFFFRPSPPVGTSTIGWGSTVLGGDYAETITGPHKNPLSVGGAFVLRRVNEIGTLSTP